METALHKVLKELFNLQDSSQFEQIIHRCNLRGLNAGEKLYQQGDLGVSIYFIIEGKLAVHKLTAMAEKTQAVALLAAGAVVGESVLCSDGIIRSSTLIAVEKSVLAEMDSKSFTEIERENPELAILLMKKILKLSSLRLQKSSERLARIL